METTLKNFARKTCYDHFQAYDVTLICSLFVRITYHLSPMTWYTTYHLQPDLNRVPPPLQGSTLTLHYHKKPFPKSSNGGLNRKNLVEIFMVDARILYVLVVKKLDFLDFLNFMCHFKSSTFIICMADFQAWFRPWWWSHLDLSFIHKINLTKSSF
jgi:hypothetical protein